MSQPFKTKLAGVGGLYRCKAGTHSNGGVTGMTGQYAAREILRDVRDKRCGASATATGRT